MAAELFTRGARKLGLLLTLVLGAVRGAAAQALPDNVPRTPPPPPPGVSATLDSARAVRGARLAVTLYTYGPGDEVFERFGHIALAIADSATGEEIAYNWGMFDFNQPNFLGRFLTGDTRYWMAGYRTIEFNAFYQSQNRAIRKQVLALTPLQKGALQDFVGWNGLEDNKYYRYDYYRDNCSTRVRDAIDWAVGGTLRRTLDTAWTPYTWRGETARITGDNLPIYAGIEVALGQSADRALTRWQSAFLPERFAADLAAVMLPGGRRLVVQDSVLFAAATRVPLLAEPPRWLGRAFAAGVVVALALLVLARWPALSSLVTLFGTLWYLVAGVLGTALLLAGTVTKHAPYMGSNLTLFQAQPLLLAAGVLWWARARDTRAGRAARALAVLSALIALVGVVAQHLPMLFHQRSFEVWLFMAPVTMMLGYLARPARPRRAA